MTNAAGGTISGSTSFDDNVAVEIGGGPGAVTNAGTMGAIAFVGDDDFTLTLQTG